MNVNMNIKKAKLAITSLFVGVAMTYSTEARSQSSLNDVKESQVITALQSDISKKIDSLNTIVAPLKGDYSVLINARDLAEKLKAARADSTQIQETYNSFAKQVEEQDNKIASTDMKKREHDAARKELWALQDSTSVYSRQLADVVAKVELLNGKIARKQDGTPYTIGELTEGIDALGASIKEPLEELNTQEALYNQLDSVQTDLYAPAIDNVLAAAKILRVIKEKEQQKRDNASNRSLTARQNRNLNEELEEEIVELQKEVSEFLNNAQKYLNGIPGATEQGKKIAEELNTTSSKYGVSLSVKSDGPKP